MRKIAVFGGTGRVGSRIIEQALLDGHHVTALVRSEKLTPHPNLNIIVGNVRDKKGIEQTIDGADAVFSALGTDRTTTLAEAMPFIVEAMNSRGIRRIVTIGTAGILNSRLTPGMLRFQGGDSNRKLTFAAEEHAAVFRLLEQTGLEWTIVCPTYLPDGEARGNYRTETNFLPEGGKEITVGDTAQFAYSQLDSLEFIQTRVGIAY
ncbi:NAD(P)-dependent oxidoreductase [Planococcus sp. YIM B11945]|uniref:NAD(P)-dependent oxidoreductase n=1 Tax=Planococcus sp. YIM B11945 TaxID=3435410 RepID=UPI003D7D2660